MWARRIRRDFRGKDQPTLALDFDHRDTCRFGVRSDDACRGRPGEGRGLDAVHGGCRWPPLARIFHSLSSPDGLAESRRTKDINLSYKQFDKFSAWRSN